jgi:hypothetical protein
VSDGPFTLAAFRRILDGARQHGYRFAFFDEEPGAARIVYMRHDVDNCIDAALDMAIVEADAGVNATYFVMLRSPNYNLLGHAAIDTVRHIASLGHRIGLHHVGAGPTQPDDVRRDADLLAAAVGVPVEAFSFHNPSLRGDHRIEVHGLVNAYAPAFTERARYVSESGMRWRTLPPDALFASEGADAYQVLIHPFSYAADLRSNRDVLLHFLRRKVAELKQLNESENHELSRHPVPMEAVAAALLDGVP